MSMKREDLINAAALSVTAIQIAIGVVAFASPQSVPNLLNGTDLQPLAIQRYLQLLCMAMLYFSAHRALEPWQFKAFFIGLVVETLKIGTYAAIIANTLISGTGPSVAYSLLLAVTHGLVWYLTRRALTELTAPYRDAGQNADHVIIKKALESRLLSGLSAIAITTPLGILCFFMSVQLKYQYGWSLFLALPFFFGLFAALLHSLVSRRSSKQCLLVAQASVNVACLILFLLAVEGFICIALAYPIMTIAAGVGGLVGFEIQNMWFAKSRPVLMCLLLVNPLLIQVEQVGTVVNRKTVTSQMIVRADTASVWRVFQNTIPLGAYTESLESIGFSVPRSATLLQTENGAALRCLFRDNPIDFPVDRLVQDREISFIPLDKTPIPMKEMSIYEDIDAPHLHGYFTVERGSITLQPLQDGTTLLVASTQFTYRIAPRAYWNWWSELIIDQLHQRVLGAIKSQAESTRG